MSINFIPEKNQFILNTRNTTYAFEVAEGRYLRHLYYGKRTEDVVSPPPKGKSFSPNLKALGTKWSPDTMLGEMSFYDSGDFRIDALRIKGEDGTSVTDFVYDSYRIFYGRESLDGLPEARADGETETLEITMTDEVTDCKLFLYYTVFADTDVISRYIALENRGACHVTIQKCMPLCVDIDRDDLELVSLWGTYGKECNLQRLPLIHGISSIRSERGTSSHQHNPFLALCAQNATEEKGDVYGFNFVWSGSFLNQVERDQMGYTRVLMGLGDTAFSYLLKNGERFVSPEAVMTYTCGGIGQMSRQFHKFIREHILPREALLPHPVVLNTWEACYFNIDHELLVEFSAESAKVGFDMLVMDDGWFGARECDNAALGDWYVNEKKFPEGLKCFVRKIKDNGVKFGIWIEPEMINPNSDLYRAHPDWCLRVEGREPLVSRNQLVLDMSNPAVIEYLKDIFSKTFDGVELDYFKWDMNRHLCGVGSAYLTRERQGETRFRYMKGVYALLSWFREKFPDAVIETCSGGGGRYDLGMMCYGIQIWTSDNTNPYIRTDMQAAALRAYPAATMSCHVSNPKDNLKSLDYRFKVAVGGMLGYELNILNMSDEIKAQMREQVRMYKEFEHIVRLGDYYCLASPDQYPYSAYLYSYKEGSEILMTVIERTKCPKGSTKLLRLRTAKAQTYTEIYSGKIYSGAELRHGIRIPLTGEPDSASLMYFKAN